MCFYTEILAWLNDAEFAAYLFTVYFHIITLCVALKAELEMLALGQVI